MAILPDREPNPGGLPGPFDCFLLICGVKTLAAHMDRYVANAERAARWLQARCRLRLRDILLGIVDAG